MSIWTPDFSGSMSPRYQAIADSIETDIQSGKLKAGDRLPPQRQLAARIGIDFTTVARGYAEARKRGIIDSQVGRGTFVTKRIELQSITIGDRPDPRREGFADYSMNMPPDPDDPELIKRMKEGLATVSSNILTLLRYQEFGGSAVDKEAATTWLSRRGLVPTQERMFITPGAHPALLAILSTLAAPGDEILSEAVTYPGIRSIAAQLRLNLTGIAMDKMGILPEALEEKCRTGAPKALYLNPTLQNPTTITVPVERRQQLCAIAQKYGLPILEDDAYGFIPLRTPAPFAALAPNLTWHIGGVAKCIGAGLRLAYVVAPDTKAAWPFVGAMRASSVMASPLTVALATRWIEDGTADAILHFIRKETAIRQEIARHALPEGSFQSDDLSFNLWLQLPHGWTRAGLSSHMRTSGIGVVESDAFTVAGPPLEAVRVCLGGPVKREKLRSTLEFMAHAIENSPEMASAFF